MSAVEIPVPKIEERALTLVEQARGYAVRDAETYALAGEHLKGVMALRQEAENHHRPIIQAAHRTHKLACDALNKVDKPLAEIEIALRTSRASWQQAEERRIAAEQERLRREEEERRQQETQRLIREAQAREAAEAEQRIAEAKAFGDVMDTTGEVAAIEEQTERNMEAVADQIQREQESAPLVLPVPQAAFIPRTSGISQRKSYKARVENAADLLRAALASDHLRGLIRATDDFVGIAMPALHQMARAQGLALRIPGLKVIEITTESVRRS